MKGEWVCEKLMRNWLSFELKSLQKSVYAPCSEKHEGYFFVNKGSVEEGGHVGI